MTKFTQLPKYAIGALLLIGLSSTANAWHYADDSINQTIDLPIKTDCFPVPGLDRPLTPVPPVDDGSIPKCKWPPVCKDHFVFFDVNDLLLPYVDDWIIRDPKHVDNLDSVIV
ncbi:MAG: hypothetical protein JAY94_04565 [Candidatus Thiodiazotropha endolucinida]|nr:hypothetical protein [Candidatus Thiodiazotropha taylori]MCW4316762.1 hypothetical protein [Candidatus Thiodiazotropha taylori]